MASINAATPVITNFYSSNLTSNSVTLYFSGIYNTAYLYRNNVLLTTNALSPYIDTSGVMPSTTYIYSIVPYNVLNISGVTISTTVNNNSSSFNIIDPSGLKYYFLDGKEYTEEQYNRVVKLLFLI